MKNKLNWSFDKTYTSTYCTAPNKLSNARIIQSFCPWNISIWNLINKKYHKCPQDNMNLSGEIFQTLTELCWKLQLLECDHRQRIVTMRWSPWNNEFRHRLYTTCLLIVFKYVYVNKQYFVSISSGIFPFFLKISYLFCYTNLYSDWAIILWNLLELYIEWSFLGAIQHCL